MARRELGPASLAIVQALAAAVGDTDAALLVGCSGGPDSLALAFATRRCALRRDLPYAAVVVDHGLQPGSAKTATAAGESLTALGYEDVSIRLVSVHGSGGPESAARDARYAALDAEAERRRSTLLLGHTLDDQAETVLLGLARGSGPRSLAGMRARTVGTGGVTRLRPLLDLRRSTTRQACAELGLTPWDDPHNVDPHYARVRVRRTVLPVLESELGPGIAPALARTAVLAGDDADLLDALAASAYASVQTPPAELDCVALRTQPPALRRRILRLWLRDAGVADLTFAHLAGVDRLLTDWHGQVGVEVPGATVVRLENRLRLR